MVSRDGQTDESKMRLRRFAEIFQAKPDSSPEALLHAMNEAGLFGLERTIAQQAVERDKVHTLLTPK